MVSAADILSQAADTYRERNQLYGNNYKRFGEVMKQLLPDGLHIDDADDYNRLGILIQIVAKLTRYGQNFKTGHLDSIHDIIVYAAMLEELDREKLERS